MYNVQKQGIYFLLVGLFKKTKKNKKKPKQNKIYSKINIDKGYLPSSIYIDRGGNIGLYKF
jgi:plastocyanin domain-containing protein